MNESDQDQNLASLIALRFRDSNTDDWHESRARFRANASDVGNMLGIGHNSLWATWAEKTGRSLKKAVTPFVQQMFDNGHEDEEVLIAQLVQTDPVLARYLRVCLDEETFSCFTCGQYVYMGDLRFAATPDRMLWLPKSKLYIPVEAKSRQNLNPGRPPTLNQWAQMQQQLACTDAPFGIYVCDNVRQEPSTMVRCIVMRSHAAWSIIYERVNEFLHLVDTETEPPKRQAALRSQPWVGQLKIEYRNSVRRIWVRGRAQELCSEPVECLELN